MKDPYKVLGVARDATLDEIKQAFRQLAKESHPDRNPGDAAAEERFKDVTAAYEILTDPEKRAMHQRGGDWRGGDWGGAGAPPWAGRDDIFDAGFGSGDTAADLFGDIAGNRRGRGGTSMKIPGEDMAEEIRLPFLEAAAGVAKTIDLATQISVDVIIPAGVRDGEVVTVPGYGFPGLGGAPPGNLNVIVRIDPDPVLSRDVFDVRMEFAATTGQMAEGARVVVPTIGGEMGLDIPAGAKPDDALRLKGMGFKDPVSGRRGDQIVTLTSNEA